MAIVYISMGSNIDRENQIVIGVKALQRHFDSIEISSVYECEPVGFSGDNFFNLVIKAETQKTPEEVGHLLKQLEIKQGRTDFAKKFSPRMMDIDILLYDNLILETPVQVPRNEIPKNAYVLQPLAEIAGDLIHPVLCQSYQQLWLNYDKQKQKLRKVPFIWPE